MLCLSFFGDLAAETCTVTFVKPFPPTIVLLSTFLKEFLP